MKNLDFQPYSALNARRRVLILLLAIATALIIALLMLYRPGAAKALRQAPLPCVEDGVTRCVGGMVDVLPVPAPASSASLPL